jgi:hypothetical protein
MERMTRPQTRTDGGRLEVRVFMVVLLAVGLWRYFLGGRAAARSFIAAALPHGIMR